MGKDSSIEWTGNTWTPIRARNVKTGKVGWHCEHASDECRFCYSEGLNLVYGTGLEFKPGHLKNGDVELFLDETMLLAPLGWPSGTKVFVCSMTDLFGQFVPDEWIDKIFAVMAVRSDITFQVLTKRSIRMREYFGPHDEVGGMTRDCLVEGEAQCIWEKWKGTDPSMWLAVHWPLSNAWLGVSVGRRRHLDRIHDLIHCPAALRWVSFEPLLESLGDVADWLEIDWAVIGLESRGGRSSGLGPVTSLMGQLRKAGVATFVKQLGTAWARKMNAGLPRKDPRRVHGKGGEMGQWPVEFQVREWPRDRPVGRPAGRLPG